MMHMLQWLYTYVSSVCSKCFICFLDVRGKCFIWMLHMFHTYVASVLSGCYICLQWFFKSFRVFCKCFRRILQVFQLFRKVDPDIAHVAMRPTLSQPSTTAAWVSCMRVGEKKDGALLGSRRGKQRAMVAGAQAVPAQHAVAASGGGAGGKRRERGRADKDMKLGCSFLGAAASGVETDYSHGCLDYRIRPGASGAASGIGSGSCLDKYHQGQAVFCFLVFWGP
jgi:hypothetical protein